MEKPTYFVPDKVVWEQQKALARCKCTDPDRCECVNFEVECTTVNGNEACTCRCHKAVL